MRIICASLLALSLLSGVANAQSVEIYGSGGPTLVDAGNSFAAGVGFLPNSRLTLAVNFERTHIAGQTTESGNRVSHLRGGTLLLGSAEVRFAPFGQGRFGPFALAGLAAGISRPNVNEVFTIPVTNHVRGLFFGGGVQVPLNDRATFFADARMMVGGEGNDGIVAVAPVRAGMSWRF